MPTTTFSWSRGFDTLARTNQKSQVKPATGTSRLAAWSGGPRTASHGGSGTDAEVAWIEDGTSTGLAITAAIPPVFEAYATVVLPHRGEGQDRHDRAVLVPLSEQSPDQRWWLGYLDTGADDIVFPDAPTVTLYAGWHYVLVEAGPEQATTWRQNDLGSFWQGRLA
jgi:hypothetical protein